MYLARSIYGNTRSSLGITKLYVENKLGNCWIYLVFLFFSFILIFLFECLECLKVHMFIGKN